MLKARCSRCGIFDFRLPVPIGPQTNVVDCATNCPYCGGVAEIQDVRSGRPQPFIQRATRLFTSATVEELERFRIATKAAVAGGTAETTDEYGELLAFAQRWGVPALNLLLTIIAIVIAIRAAQDSGKDSAALLAEQQRQTALLEQLVEGSRAPEESPAPRSSADPPRPPSPLLGPMTTDELRSWWNASRKL